MSRDEGDLGFALPPPANGSRIKVILIVAIVFAGAFAFAYSKHRTAKLDAVETETGVVKVETIKANVVTSDRALTLPGVIRALQETKIYPRTTGYVKRFLVDIGDKVKEGQLLAEIDTPELTAELAQAEAQLAQTQAAVKQAIAQRDYSKANLARNQELQRQQLVAAATVEQIASQAGVDAANVIAAQANVNAAEANLKKLRDQTSFAKVTAPFAGTVTSRSIDVGTSLVGDTATTAMFTIDATDPVRIFLDVPQTVAPLITNGTKAGVVAREYPGRTFDGTVARSAGALDPDLHTMTTEVRVPNADGALLPGMYVSATLELPVTHKVLEIPATALYNDTGGLRVAVVTAQNKIHFTPITIERDTGATLWIASGLTGDERFLRNTVPSLQEGDTVEVLPPKPTAPAAGAGSATGSAAK
jgi:RND family efflux transporter MFP subunit